MSGFEWPPGFVRVPDEDWTRAPVDELATKYDRVENHGWYANLDPTVDELAALVRPGDVVVDYSGGTGILIDRLLHALRDRAFGIVDVDSSPKFLRLALEKLGSEPRVAFRLIRYLKDAKRLQYLDEVLDPALVERRVDAVVSTNAVHLYYDLDDTFASWARCLRPGGRALVQSGNIARDAPTEGSWIIDDTVHAIHRAALDVAREDEAYAAYRTIVNDPDRLAPYDRYREKIFLPARPLSYYTDALERAGLRVRAVRHRAFRARTPEWYQFLAVYHEGVLGWLGGVERIDGRPASEDAVRQRLALMRAAMDRVFQGRDAFEAEWTYVTCERA